MDKIFYWRIRAKNKCGYSDWSETFSFRSINLVCEKKQSIDGPVEIDNQAPSIIFSKISNPIQGKILNVEVSNLKGSHTFISDLQFSLISPSNKEVILVNKECSSNENFNIGFSDLGIKQMNCPMTDQLLYQPLEPLSDFIGENGFGDWKIKIEDTNGFDGGQLESWTLKLCIERETIYYLTAEIDSILLCTNESLKIDVKLGPGFINNGELKFNLNDPERVNLVEPNKEGVLSLIFNPNNNEESGQYPIELTVSDIDNNLANLLFDLEVIDVPVAVNLDYPANEELEVITNPVFTWKKDSFASSYTLEISTSMTFDQDVFTVDIESNSYSYSDNLELDQDYYWRVTSNNKCGKKISEIFEFKTTLTNSINSYLNPLIELFPNPTANEVFLKIPSSLRRDKISISVYDTQFKLVYQVFDSFKNSHNKVNLENLSRGIYLMRIESASYSQISRIVLQ